jgi:hypothetical protein
MPLGIEFLSLLTSHEEGKHLETEKYLNNCWNVYDNFLKF